MRHTPTRLVTSEVPDDGWITDDGMETRIGVSTRSPRRAAVLSIASVISGVALLIFFFALLKVTIIQSGGLPPNWLPQWLPEPRPNMPWPLGRLWALFGISLLGGIVVAFYAAAAIAGRVEVILRDGRGRLFSGFGPLGITRQFDPSTVRQISIKRMMNPDQLTEHPKHHEIVMEAEKTVRFGFFLNPEQQAFMQRALSEVLQVGAVRHGRDRGVR